MPVLAGTWIPQVGAALVQWSCDGAKLNPFSSGSSLCIGIYSPGFDVCRGLCSHSVMLCCLGEMKKSRFIKGLSNKKVKVYQRLCSTLAQGWSSLSTSIAGGAADVLSSEYSVKAALFPELPKRGFLLEIWFYLTKGVLRDRCFESFSCGLCVNGG